MPSDLVVVPSPGLDDRGSFPPRTEPLHAEAAEALLTETSVEAFVGPILPRLPGRYGGGLDTLNRRPAQDGAGDNSGPLSDRR